MGFRRRENSSQTFAMISTRRLFTFVTLLVLHAGLTSSFSIQHFFFPRTRTSSLPMSAINTESKGFAPKTTTSPALEVTEMNSQQVKDRLVSLLSRMTGTADDYKLVEAYVNRLEELYQPTQTLSFLNLALTGQWQLLFSTNLAGTPNPAQFRLRELTQTISCRQLNGTITNQALWDLSESQDASFVATGTFAAKCSYEIVQGARMSLHLDDHVLQPSKGSPIPSDVPGLVGLLHRSMPKALFDPSEHSVDTTYLDGDLRIVRYTGPRYEGNRDIFQRVSKLEWKEEE